MNETYFQEQIADLQSQLADAAQRERELRAEIDALMDQGVELALKLTAAGERERELIRMAEEDHAEAAGVDEATRRLREAATEFMATAAELRREISPDKGCGYLTYRRVWDANFADEVKLKAAINPEGSDVVPT